MLAMLRKLLRLNAVHDRPRRKRTKRQCRPLPEALEDRTLPAVSVDFVNDRGSDVS
jgi:hypothetical protein